MNMSQFSCIQHPYYAVGCVMNQTSHHFSLSNDQQACVGMAI